MAELSIPVSYTHLITISRRNNMDRRFGRRREYTSQYNIPDVYKRQIEGSTNQNQPLPRTQFFFHHTLISLQNMKVKIACSQNV